VAGDGVFETSGDPHDGGPARGSACGGTGVRAVDPTAAVEDPKTLEEIRNDSLASRTFAMQLLVGFSVVGSVLTLVGIYGVRFRWLRGDASWQFAARLALNKRTFGS
jgi:hypothetical protein